MEKSISYTARDFNSIKKELIDFSKKYYPELAEDFNDASVGSWFIDLVSAVGDELNYYIDRCYQENTIDSANLKSTLYNIAKSNGIKIQGPKASMCEVTISCILPAGYDGDMSQPNWHYAPVLKMGSRVGNASHQFELIENVNFAEQFNSEGVSNRTFIPRRTERGIDAYVVRKTTVVSGSVTKVYKRAMTIQDVEPFMEVVLPEKDILNVESIIFKQSSDFKYSPEMYEYFINDEEFMLQNESIKTYRYFEVDSLSEQYRFAPETRYAENGGVSYVADEYNPNVFVDYTESVESGETSQRTSRFFKGMWKPITQKFITEMTENGYTKIIFGPATSANDVPSGMTSYGEWQMSKIINNDMLGVLPKVGWTMFVLYRTGGGVSSNLAPGSINMLLTSSVDFVDPEATDATLKNRISSNIQVTNNSPSIAGKDAPSVDEIRFMTKYAVAEQKRCVTIKDYKARVMAIPPKYGCPYRCNAVEDNNKIRLSSLFVDGNGKLTDEIPQIVADNMVEYISQYKMLTDYIEIVSGKIYNVGFVVDVFIDKTYVVSDVIKSIINKVSSYMNVDTKDMGEDIFIGDLEKELNLLDGVVSLIDLKVYNLYSVDDNKYSKSVSPLPRYVDYSIMNCTDTNSVDTFPNIKDDDTQSFRIDLDKIDSVLFSNYDSMFEIKNPKNDVCVRYKLR